MSLSAEAIRQLKVDDFVDDDDPGGTGPEEAFRNYILREALVLLIEIDGSLNVLIER